MCRKLIPLVSVVLALSLIINNEADAADPVGWWQLDDGAGLIAADSLGDHDGTLTGPLTWIDGVYGGALQFQGGNGSPFVDLGAWQTDGPDGLSLCLWVKWDGTNSLYQGLVSQRDGTMYWWTELNQAASELRFKSNTSPQSSLFLTGEHLVQGEWTHVAFSHDAAENTGTIYLNGEERLSGEWDLPAGDFSNLRSGIGVVNTADGLGTFNGALDEVMIFQVPLSQDEILAVMEGAGGLWPYASKPTPADGALYPDTWVSMSWKPGGYAVSHDVYMGDNFDDVNDGTGDTFRVRQPLNSLYFVAGFVGYAYPDGLVPGTTYYWRIDEVNDVDPNSPWKGDVWSFTVPSLKAYKPNPADGLEFIAPDVTLSWTGGLGSKLHYIFIGESFEEVDAGTLGIFAPFPNYTPSGLELGKTYYWRVDEDDGDTTHKGNVWSFETLPDIPISDPNLVGWWKLEEGAGATAVDWSGNGNHGVISNTGSGGLGDGRSAWFTDPDFGMVLSLSGSNNSGAYVSTGSIIPAMTPTDGFSWAFWAKQEGNGSGDNDIIMGNRWGASTWVKFTPTKFEFTGSGTLSVDYDDISGGSWIHHAVVKDGTSFTYYRDGVLSNTAVIDATCPQLPFFIGGEAGGERWSGYIHDVRIYNKSLTVEEIQKAMRGDPLIAGVPNPANGATLFIRDALPLTWSAGENASQHDVYYGTDRDAVDDADTSTADIYRGRQAGTSYSPPEAVEWGGGPYYWRIDEFNTDGTISKGRIWSFTVADFILVDDFENYNVGDNEIWYAWHDGLGAGAQGSPGFVPSNGTGSMIGDDSTGSYTEESIVHGGSQSMPYWYDNNKQGFNKYSEAELTLTWPRDWTQEGVAELSLWFRGNPASVGSFVEAPVGTYTMTGSGADIWNQSDEFHYSYKTLTGQGSIQAQVLSVDNTNVWAKAGVMIRETLDPDSKHATMVVTPASGVSFQRRPETGAASLSDTTAGITAPYWVKIERDLAGNFTAYSSTDGSTWQAQGVWEPIQMVTNVYIGLAVTSHDAALTCQAVFSNVTTTGNVTGQWMNQDIGIESNDAEPLYVALSNTAGAPAMVVHDDPVAAQINIWTEWVIPLQAFADQGINLANVDRIAIGLGTQGNVSIPGGSGKIYIDDIRLIRSEEVAEE